MSTPISKKFGGKTYHLAITRVGKQTAQKEAKKLRKGWGSLARVVREPDGKYCVYSYHLSSKGDTVKAAKKLQGAWSYKPKVRELKL